MSGVEIDISGDHCNNQLSAVMRANTMGIVFHKNKRLCTFGEKFIPNGFFSFFKKFDSI